MILEYHAYDTQLYRCVESVIIQNLTRLTNDYCHTFNMNQDLTIAYLKEAFTHYNQLIFQGKLPLPALKLSRGKTRLGQMACKRRTHWRRTIYSDYTISISTYYALNKEEIDDVLIHEMIHYYIAYTRQKDTSAHGVIFRQMMADINQRFGRHITISTRTKDIPTRIAQKPKKFLVVALETIDKQYFLSSVMPSAARKVANMISRSREIKKYNWYYTYDEYFRDMPRVRSLRGRKVSLEVYIEMRSKMERIG